jgi:hypothetical protein
MDFLADITFGEPTLENTRLFFSEIMADLDKNRILLEYISGTHDFEFQFVIRNVINCDDKCKKEPCSETCKKCIIMDTSNDIGVSIPNDVLGCHAFYLILENIIRNCAKHNSTFNKPLRLYIDFDECATEDEFYEVKIYDNIEKNNLSGLIISQNEKLNSNLLESGKLRSGAWGLIEMEASAAYLRKKPIELINDEEFKIDISNNQSYYPPKKNGEGNNQPNFLKAIGYHKHYGYRLFLLKPKELLIVISQDKIEDINSLKPENLARLRKQGIKLCIVNNENEENLNLNNVYAFPIMLFYGTKADYEKFVIPNITGLPNRQLVYFAGKKSFVKSRFAQKIEKTEIEFILKILAEDTPKKLINYIWKNWLLKQLAYLGLKISSGFWRSSFSKINIEPEYFSDQDFDESFIVDLSDHGISGCLKMLNLNSQENQNAINDDIFAALNGANSFNVNTGLRNQISYSEPYNSKDYFLLKKVLKNKAKEFPDTIEEHDFPALCRLIEGSVTTIYIIDERLQELAENTTYRPEQKAGNTSEGLQFTDLLFCTNVIIPLSGKESTKIRRQDNNSRKFNLNETSFNEIKDKTIIYLRSLVKTKSEKEYDKNKADFLLIHLGVLEKLITATKWPAGKDDIGVKKFIEEQILQNKNVETKIIIISGRGKPHNMPPGYLYLNFSIVSQYCIENRLKYFLNEVVYSSKKI